MVAVARQIQEVVQEIGARGAEAESDEDEQPLPQKIEFVDPARRQQRQEHERVLEPLMRPDRLKVQARRRTIARQNFCDLGTLGDPGGEAGRGLDDHGLAGGAPGGFIAPPAADVVEALQAELGDQPLPLPLPGEVDPAVAREHQVEQPEVARHLIREASVGRGRQYQRPAATLFRREPVEQSLAVRQAGHVRSRLLCQPPLQGRLAPGQPERH